MSETKTFPAPFLVHWATGPVPCCEEHAEALVGLGRFMGTHLAVTENLDKEAQCTNCINEEGEG